MFESPREIRLFLARLARSARRHGVEIHAYSILATHFHLLVRSHRGEMAAPLHDAQSAYARRFNRVRGRPGPLVQARFRSSRVDSMGYLVNVVRYIDHNPVEAGLVARPEAYPFGSVGAYVGGRVPPWLTTGIAHRVAREGATETESTPHAYRRTFGLPPSASERRALDLALARGHRRVLRLGPLAAAHPIVQAQLADRAQLADGMSLLAPMIDDASLVRALEAARAALGAWSLNRGTRARCGWALLECLLLHEFAGETQSAIAARKGYPCRVVSDWIRDARALLEVDAAARARLHDVLDRLDPVWRRPAPPPGDDPPIRV